MFISAWKTDDSSKSKSQVLPDGVYSWENATFWDASGAKSEGANTCSLMLSSDCAHAGLAVAKQVSARRKWTKLRMRNEKLILLDH